MEQYISKAALVAEIERQISAIDNCPKITNTQISVLEGDKVILTKLFSFLDTIEMKEVDLEANIQDYINSHFTEGFDGGMISDWYKVLGGVHYNDLKEIAKHFFELGLQSTLTEENMRLVWTIGNEIPPTSEEDFYKELLKRFKAQKGKKV